MSDHDWAQIENGLAEDAGGWPDIRAAVDRRAARRTPSQNEWAVPFSEDFLAYVQRIAEANGIPANRIVLHRDAMGTRAEVQIDRAMTVQLDDGAKAVQAGDRLAFHSMYDPRTTPARRRSFLDPGPAQGASLSHAVVDEVLAAYPDGRVENPYNRPSGWGHSHTDTAQEAPKMDRLEVIEDRIAELEAQAAALRQIPDLRAMEDETTLSYERSYSGGDPFAPWYVFVAVKMAGFWHTSGAQGGEKLDDNRLRSLLASPSVRNIFRASAWELVAKEVATDEAGKPAEDS